MSIANSGEDAARPIASDIADLTAVDPRRWAEARRRVSVLNDWVKKTRHSRAECESAADRLGMTPKHFYRLASAWRKHRDVTRLHALGVKRGEIRGRRDLSADARRAISEAIDLLGPDARLKDVVAEVARRSAALGVAPASDGMVHNLLMRAREAGGGRGPGTVVVAKVFCVLPTFAPGGAVEQVIPMVVAVFAPRNIIVAHRLVWAGEDLPTATSSILRDPAVTGKGLPIVLSRDLADGLPSDGGGDVTVAKSSEILIRALGSRIGTLPIKRRRRRANAGDVGAPTVAIHAPLTIKDAEIAVRIAIDDQNRRRGGDPG